MSLNNINLAPAYWALKNVSVSPEINSIEAQLKIGVDNLVHQIKHSLTHPQESLVDNFKALQNEALIIRLTSIEWVGNQDINLEKLLKDFSASIDSAIVPEVYDSLCENLKFGLRISNKVSKNFIKNNNISTLSSHLNKIIPKQVNKQEFLLHSIQELNKLIPSDIVQNILKLLESSILLELGIIAGELLINDTSTIASIDKINALNDIIVDNAQEYASIARVIGLVKSNRNITPIINAHTPITEDIELAELGMEDYLKDIDHE